MNIRVPLAPAALLALPAPRAVDAQIADPLPASIANGHLARSGEPVVNGRSVATPGGRNFFLGADPGGPANR